MHSVAEWLEKLGMSEYAQRFAENRIDFQVLPDLTDHDLEKLGVILGDRRKMLRAIANLEVHKITACSGGSRRRLAASRALNRMRDLQPAGPIRHYEREEPGEMISRGH